MIRQTIVVTDENGLDMNAASQFVQIANRFSSKILVSYGDKELNAKSLLGMVGANIKQGDCIEISCNGTDQEAAILALSKVIDKSM